MVAVLKDEGRPMIVGGGRYIVLQPGRAEVAFVVVDQYQGHGAPAPLGDIGTRSRHSRVDRGDLARQHFNAESVREKWISLKGET